MNPAFKLSAAALMLAVAIGRSVRYFGLTPISSPTCAGAKSSASPSAMLNMPKPLASFAVATFSGFLYLSSVKSVCEFDSFSGVASDD